MAWSKRLPSERHPRAITIMTIAKNFKNFKECLANSLVPFGFAARGDMLFRAVRDTMLVLEIQKDLKHSTKEEIRFTINVGLSIDVLRSSDSINGLSFVPSPDKCHWRTRLGRLLLTESDVWWSIHDEQSATAVCEEVVIGLIRVALPKVEAIASSQSLATLWKDGRGRGLTEYERRVNLAKLLCKLKRTEEAQVAIQELENASLGKSWEISARYDVKELRKLVD